MLASFRDMSVPGDLVPHCPVCGGNMDIHVRKDAFFVEDENWHEQAACYEEFLASKAHMNTFLLELGVGFNTPSIIRRPFELIAHQFPCAKLARINLAEAGITGLPTAKGLELAMDIGQALEYILGGLCR